MFKLTHHIFNFVYITVTVCLTSLRTLFQNLFATFDHDISAPNLEMS